MMKSGEPKTGRSTVGVALYAAPQGRCQNCGVSCADGSVSRCEGCLEKARRDQRGRDGTTGVRPKRRRRPMLGEWRIRNRAWEHDEQRRQRDRLRARRWRWEFGE